jgi:hypothetical protein
MKRKIMKFPYGDIEPHKGLLEQIPNDSSLFKIMSFDDFLKSVKGKYLYFRRVDKYKDCADKNGDEFDGDQMPLDKPVNKKAGFLKNPNYTLHDYYNQSRARTYACCLSLENTPYIWNKYGGSDINRKVCLVFNFDKLKALLNKTLHQCTKKDLLIYNGIRLKQPFNINYGKVKYIERMMHRQIIEHYPNPIEYAFLKDKKLFKEEKEFRIALSALGMGKFVLIDQKEIMFPDSLEFSFDFNQAISTQIIEKIHVANSYAFNALSVELANTGISLTHQTSEYGQILSAPGEASIRVESGS